MKPTRCSACFCRRSAAWRATTAPLRAITALIANAVVTAITTSANAVIAAMRRLRRCCSRCRSSSKPTSSNPEISLSLALLLPSLPVRASAAIGSVG